MTAGSTTQGPFDLEHLERLVAAHRDEGILSEAWAVRVADTLAEVRRLRTRGYGTARRLAVEQLGHHRTSLEQWREPDGLLIPTEPDADERARVRDRLISAIHTLEWVIALMPEGT